MLGLPGASAGRVVTVTGINVGDIWADHYRVDFYRVVKRTATRVVLQELGAEVDAVGLDQPPSH